MMGSGESIVRSFLCPLQTRRNSWCAFLKVVRPLNCLFVMLTTLLGFWYLQSFGDIDMVFLSVIAGVSALLIAAGGYVINDFYDYEIDKINKPNRPLPKGEISLRAARAFSIVLLIVGVALAVFTRNVYCILVATINSITLFLYARFFKKSFIAGNIIVSWNACSTFLYGAILSYNLKNILPLVCFSFLYTLIREWVKIIEDYDGDMRQNVKSIAIVLGKNKTVRLLAIPSLVLIVSIAMFSVLGLYSYELYAVLSAIIIIPLVGFLIRLSKSLNTKTASNIQNYMKLNMLSVVLVYALHDIIIRFF